MLLSSETLFLGQLNRACHHTAWTCRLGHWSCDFFVVLTADRQANIPIQWRSGWFSVQRTTSLGSHGPVSRSPKRTRQGRAAEQKRLQQSDSDNRPTHYWRGEWGRWMIVGSGRHHWAHYCHIKSRQNGFGRRHNQPVDQKRNHWLCLGKALARCTGARP